MYCRKCNNLLNNEEIICSKCGFDNTQDFSYTVNEKKFNNSSHEKNKILKLYLFMISILIISCFTCLYIFSDTETSRIKNNNYKNSREVNIYDGEFIFHNIIIKYPSNSYGTSTNTIFYKNNNNYKIEFKFLNEKEYNKLNYRNLLDSKLGSINTKTIETKEGYTHLFTLNNQYYIIEINYDNEDTLEGLKHQLELTKIINTLEEKN